MAILVPEQGTVSLGSSRITPADVYVRQTAPDVSSGFEALSRALGIYANSQAASEAKAKAEQEALDKKKIPYWVNVFSQELDSNMIDEVQIGKRLPTDSKIIAADVTEGIGKRHGEQFARARMEQALREDETLRTDPVKRKAFFDTLRNEVNTNVAGREFYGAGYSGGLDAVINEYEGAFQREGAKVYNDEQESKYTSDVTKVMRYQPATGPHGSFLDFLGSFEGAGNYNAVYGNTNQSDIEFTNMSVADVLRWQKAQNAKGVKYTAIGKYQIIPDTMMKLINEMGFDPEATKFSPEMQDRMAEHLLKGRGFDEFLANPNDPAVRDKFIRNLAQEWAGLPTTDPENYGLSHYHKDGVNKHQVSLDQVNAALNNIGPAQNGLGQIETIYARTSSLNPARRRELFVNQVVDLAINTGDMSILDRAKEYAVNPKTGQSFLLEENLIKLDKAKGDVAEKRLQKVTQRITLEQKIREEKNREWRNTIVTDYTNGVSIDPILDARGEDGLVDAERKAYLEGLIESNNVSKTVSSTNAANFEDKLLAAGSIGGNYEALMGDDPLLGEKVREGYIPTPAEIRDHINRRRDINPADKIKLGEQIPTLMEGANILRDPIVTASFTEGLGADVKNYIGNIRNSAVVTKNPRMASEVRAAFDNEIKAQVKADLEDGKGVPKGNRKLEIIDKANLKAKERFESIINSRQPKKVEGSTPPASPAPQPPKSPLPPPPKVGEVRDGYTFMGGDAADPKNWKKQ